MLKLYLCRATILAVLIIFASSMFGAIFQFSTCARMFQPQKKTRFTIRISCKFFYRAEISLVYFYQSQ